MFKKFACSIVTAGLVLGISSSGWAVSPAVNTSPNELKISSYNVHKATPTPEVGVPSWGERRGRLTNYLAVSGADVVSLQETVGWDVGGVTHTQDIANLAAQRGYTYVEPVLDECVRPRDAAGQLAGPNPCDNTTSILFNSATTSVMPTSNGRASSGEQLTGSITDTGSANENRRSLSWVYLTKGGRNFFVVDVHTDSDKSAAAEAARVRLANALPAWVDAMNAARGVNLPVFITGDLNSYKLRQPQGMQQILANAGFADPYYTAPTKIGARYATVNVTPATKKFYGFPPKPYKYSKKKEPSRIDYVLYRGATPLVYETVVKLNANGTFDENYRLSDHNAVEATFAW